MGSNHDAEKNDRAARPLPQYPGIEEQICRFETAELPDCPHCASSDTASVQVGILGRTMAIAACTRKFKLIANGPKPGAYYCNACGEFFDVKE